ncbi:MAG: hypothetical protein HON53_09540 [Planctomycetaceae bacterium]|jgi:hypothetical protein|nr:hypothetical protein [Planctomycetaceae bacterium]MBT6153441.1 hypothetical protein [Planctomycetaceae bacterium]MBT6484727.1 hypothetical protein [Planctomycetaceae bacterium]MBT6496477.1 hypothetical protein [Planctomycetaceae bacterium]
MAIPQAILTADRDRKFDDWGVSITFRQVTQTFDTETQQVSEDVVDTPLTAIIGAAPSRPTKGTAAQHLAAALRLQIKAEELPTTVPCPASRIVYNAIEYDIIVFNRSTGGLVYTLDCRKTND